MRHIFTALFPLFLVFAFQFAGAQTVISVRNENGEVIPGAVIRCETGFQGITDLSGLAVLPEGSLECSVEHVSYQPYGFKPGPGQDTLIIQLEPGMQLLPEITIQGFQEPVRLSEAAGGHSFLSSRQISVFSAVTPVAAFNSLAGVRMEQRSPSSYRINIRGSTLRSPFGVRNVKVYWNQIPLTEPTGNTPLNMIDLDQLGNVQIIRGPSGSIYGAGTGGVMLMQDERVAGGRTHAEVSYTTGSFGLSRIQGAFRKNSENQSLALSLSRSASEGYRDHSESDRINIQLSGKTRISQQHNLNFQVLYTDLFYELPGGLTAEQFADDPTSARPVAVVQNSLIDQDYFIAGIGHEYSWEEGSLATSLFASASNKRNPFISNYEFENLKGAGLRTRILQKIGILNLSAGGEWQWGKTDAENFGNTSGFPDSLRYSDRNSQFTGYEFAQLTFSDEHWHISIAGSLNHLDYRFNRLRDAALDSAYTLERGFDPIFSPRIGIVRKWKDFSVHASYSEGYSPPGLDEVRTSDAQINTALNAEVGRNIEIGTRGYLFDNRLSVDLNLFYMQLNSTIVSQLDENGTSSFYNSGTTDQRGMELMMGWIAVNQPSRVLKYMYIKTALTVYDFTFRDYVREAGDLNVDYGGNDLTGTPPLSIAAWLSAETKKVQADISYQYVSDIPLNDANTVFADQYHLLQASLNWDIWKGEEWGITVFGGIDNLLNQSYSLGNDLNAFGGRFFNAAATRNWFGGIRVDFDKNQ